MTFLHRMGEAQIVHKPGDIDWVKTGSGVATPLIQHGNRIKFSLLSQPMDWTSTSRFSDGSSKLVFRGKYETEDPDEIEFLVNNPRYGIDFIAITDEGRELIPDEWVIQTYPDNTAKCRVCDRLFKNAAGAHGHLQSKEHLDMLGTQRREKLLELR